MKPLIAIISILVLSSSCKKFDITKNPTGNLKITFQNLIAGNPMVLNSITYVNPFLEIYTVKKFRYYISNVTAGSGKYSSSETNSYHLIDQSVPASLSFTFPAYEGTSSSFSFVLGVDSLRNVSGAQTGALDPANDMFWTWSSGYVMAKMEGNSPASTLVNNAFEFHIGGFSGVNNVLKTITLDLPAGQPLNIHEGKTSEIIIQAEANSWWQDPNDMKIAVNPSITSPGPLARKMSDNYSKMFTVLSVTNN